LDDLAVGRVREGSGAAGTLAVLTLAIARSIAALVNETAGLGEFVRRYEGDVSTGKAGVLKASLDERAAFAIQTAIAGLEVSDKGVELAVVSVRIALGEDLAILNQSGGSRAALVGESDGVRFGSGADDEERDSGNDGGGELHVGEEGLV